MGEHYAFVVVTDREVTTKCGILELFNPEKSRYRYGFVGFKEQIRWQSLPKLKK